MHIVLNGWFLAHHPHTGSGQYLRALLEWLPRVAPEHTYTVVVPVLGAAAPEAVRLYRAAAPASALGKLFFEQVAFPCACGRLRATVAHVPHWAGPVYSPVPVVVTIHDLIPLLLPEYGSSVPVRAYTALMAATAKRAALVLTVSEAARRDVLRYLHLPPQRVRAVHNAAGPLRAPASPEALARYHLPENFVLYLGGFDARKNVPLLLRSWAALAAPLRRQYPLVLAGQVPPPAGRLFADLPRLVAELKIGETVKFIGPVPETEKAALYRRASLFVYPSRYEGFGLPPLEALTCGIPVITTTAASLPEVVGEAACLVPPDDAEALRQALTACLTEATLRRQLGERGPAQAQKFSWEKTARAVAAAYAYAARAPTDPENPAAP